MTTKQLTRDEKIDMIFNYLFSGSSHIEEEEFWNKLSEEEVKKLKQIEKEKNISFNALKKSF